MLRFESIVLQLVVLVHPVTSHHNAVRVLDIKRALVEQLVAADAHSLERDAFRFVPLPQYEHPLRLASKSDHVALLVEWRERHRNKLL